MMEGKKSILDTEISIPKMKTIVFVITAFIFFWVINLLFFKEAPEGNQSNIEILIKALGKGFVNTTDLE
jgi:hypothetical protein